MIARVVLVVALIALEAAAAELFNTKVGVVDPFPREVGRGKTVLIRGVLKADFRTPELIIIAPNGRTFLNKDNQVAEQQFAFTAHFEWGKGPYRMEIMAHKPNSTRTVARFTIWHGVRRPPAEKEPPPPTGPAFPLSLHERLAEKRLFTLLNVFRKHIGLAPAGWNEAVAARAREHALRMAKARRRVHKFGRVGGVTDMLGRDGAGPGELSGPDRPWPRVTTRRPFPPHQPQLPGPRVYNHVVPFVIAEESLEVTLEKYFVREAAFRLCALDPHCIELAIGAARTPPRKKGERTNPLLYWSICFVQVNDKTVADAQDEAYAAILKDAGRKDPVSLRAVGLWGRDGKAVRTLRRALKDRRPEVFGAALDGLLLLDEVGARAQVEGVAVKARTARERRRYADEVDIWRRFEHVVYDRSLRFAALHTEREAETAVQKELAALRKLEGPARAIALQDLLRRVRGLEIEALVRQELER